MGKIGEMKKKIRIIEWQCRQRGAHGRWVTQIESVFEIDAFLKGVRVRDPIEIFSFLSLRRTGNATAIQWEPFNRTRRETQNRSCLEQSCTFIATHEYNK